MADYYVSTVGNDNWSGKLPMPNASSTDGPFRTITKARDMMRANSDFTRTFVRGGDYYFTSTFTLTNLDNNHSFIAYPNETVNFYASKVLTGWVSEGINYTLYQASATGLDLFVNNQRMRCAYKGGYDPALGIKSGWISAPSNGTVRNTYFTAGAVTSADYQTGMYIQTFDYERLSDGMLPLAGINTTNNYCYVASDQQYAVRKGGNFRLLNNAAYISSTGEFGWRASDNRLVMRLPSGLTLLTATVRIPVVGNLITMTNCQNVVIRGITFRENKWDSDLIVITSGGYNEIVDCKFYNTGGNAIDIIGSNNNLVANNQMRWIQSGVYMSGGATDNEVYGNKFEDLGMVTKFVRAVGGDGCHGAHISYNEIRRSSRYGISIKDWNASNSNTDNVIEYNIVIDTCLESADGGAIETLGRSNNQTNSTIRHNYIKNCYGVATSNADGSWREAYKGFGIYLDDLTNDIDIVGNFIIDCSTACVYLHGGDNNNVTNNFGIMKNENQNFIQIEWVGAGVTGTYGANNIIDHNIIYSTTSSTLSNYWYLNSPGQADFHDNLIWQVAKLVNTGNWSSITTSVPDVTVNPQFNDPANDDWTLKGTSPAFGMGITDLQWANMGYAGYAGPSDYPRPYVDPNTSLYKNKLTVKRYGRRR